MLPGYELYGFWSGHLLDVNRCDDTTTRAQTGNRFVYWEFATVLFVIAISDMAELPINSWCVNSATEFIFRLIPGFVDTIMIVTGTRTSF